LKLTTAFTLTVGLVLVLALGAQLSPPARASQVPFVSPDVVATPIAALPFVISSPGLYRVTGDLSGAPGMDGIRVQADHVTIDLGGFTSSGVAGAIGIDLSSSKSHLTVANGRVTGWSTGVDVRSSGNTVRNVVAAENGSGFVVRGTYLEACQAVGRPARPQRRRGQRRRALGRPGQHARAARHRPGLDPERQPAEQLRPDVLSRGARSAGTTNENGYFARDGRRRSRMRNHNAEPRRSPS